VQVHYDEGVANHIDPEPCVGVREHVGEASAGENVGQALSRENRLTPGADALLEAEGNMRGQRVDPQLDAEVRAGDRSQPAATAAWTDAPLEFG
jgi:hypothetical protein